MADAASCRILVVSSTSTQAQQFVQRVMAVSSPESLEPPSEEAFALTNAADASSSSIPWTIANKYYTADVHFETREYNTFVGYHASEVPAVIYVWGRGDPYKEHVPALADKLQHYDPEVSLAVRLGSTQPAPTQPHSDEEEDGLDEFLSLHGFEYVDGDRAGRRPTRDGEGFSDEDSSGVPGLPRVVDALSTIMWPSLVQSAATSARKSRARELLDWARDEEAEDGLRALVASAAADDEDEDEQSEHAASGSARIGTGTDPETERGTEPKKSRMQREMEELERWLEDEDAGRGVDSARWRTDDAAAWGAPTITLQAPTGAGALDGAEIGFEDDFAEFVGAPVSVSYAGDRPAASQSQSQSERSPRQRQLQGYQRQYDANEHDEDEDEDADVDVDEGHLRPMHTGASYRTLASGSEYGGDDVFGGLDDDEGEDEDGDLPTRGEIEETSRRIFGAALDVPSASPRRSAKASEKSKFTPSGENAEATGAASSAAATHPATTQAPAPAQVRDPSLPTSATQSPDRAPSPSPSYSDADSEDEFEFGAFDLSRVLGALQGMKDEIAGMADEGERRRAAARVALGLVYGLRKEEEREREAGGEGEM